MICHREPTALQCVPAVRRGHMFKAKTPLSCTGSGMGVRQACKQFSSLGSYLNIQNNKSAR